jgi:hypothetical protein
MKKVNTLLAAWGFILAAMATAAIIDIIFIGL